MSFISMLLTTMLAGSQLHTTHVETLAAGVSLYGRSDTASVMPTKNRKLFIDDEECPAGLRLFMLDSRAIDHIKSNGSGASPFSLVILRQENSLASQSYGISNRLFINDVRAPSHLTLDAIRPEFIEAVDFSYAADGAVELRVQLTPAT